MEKNLGQTVETESSLSRNATIRQMVEEGRTAMLPFEQRELEVELLGHTATQNELSRLLGEAMTTTSETWHDNAQADAVTMQSSILVQQANGVLTALKDRYVVSYDHDEKTTVSIGALVHLMIGKYPETVLVTGHRRSLPDDVIAMVGEQSTPVNIQSPLGAAIFDQTEGSTVSYQVGERQLEATIISIEYPDLSTIN